VELVTSNVARRLTMIHIKAVYRQGQLVLEEPLEIAEGTELDVLLELPSEDEQQAWEQACNRLEDEWGVADAAYDDWRRVYSVAK